MKISPIKLFERIHAEYLRGNMVTHIGRGQKSSKQITRGRQHCVAGYIEDLVADYFYLALREYGVCARIWVDQPISVRGRSCACPDVLVCEKCENQEVYAIRAIYEIKTNTGWNRYHSDDCVIGKTGCLARLRKAKKLSLRDGTKFVLARNIISDLIILTSDNSGNSHEFDKMIHRVNNANGLVHRAWILTDGGFYSDVVPKPNMEVFSNMLSRLFMRFGV